MTSRYPRYFSKGWKLHTSFFQTLEEIQRNARRDRKGHPPLQRAVAVALSIEYTLGTMNAQPGFNAADMEKYSSAMTLSDMEIFIFPELLYSLLLANLMSPRIWAWRDDPWFAKIGNG